MTREFFTKPIQQLRALSWKTWLALSIICVPLFLINVPGQHIALLGSAGYKNLGKEFSHGYPFVAFHTSKPTYDIESFRDRSIKTAEAYVYRKPVGSKWVTTNHRRNELCQILNRQIDEVFQRYDVSGWDEQREQFCNQRRKPLKIYVSHGPELTRATPDRCHWPNWLSPECWPFTATGFKFYWCGLLLNFVLGLSVLIAAAILIEQLAFRFPWLFQFRLIHMLVFVGFFSAVLGAAIQTRHQFESEREVGSAFDRFRDVKYEVGKIGRPVMRPNWLARLIGTGWNQSHFRIQKLEIHYSEDREKLLEIERLAGQLKCVDELLIHTEALDHFRSDFDLLNQCRHLNLKVASWTTLIEWKYSMEKLESLKLSDEQFPCDTYFERKSGFETSVRMDAWKAIHSLGFRGDLILQACDRLSEQELKVLHGLSFRSVTLKRCTVLVNPINFVNINFEVVTQVDEDGRALNWPPRERSFQNR